MRARTSASTRSVLASRPVARAKSRAWRGFTRAKATPARASAAASGRSQPPEASKTTKAPVAVAAKRARAAGVAAMRRRAPETDPAARWKTSIQSLATSTPRTSCGKVMGSLSLICGVGRLGVRPMQLFRFERRRRASPMLRRGILVPGPWRGPVRQPHYRTSKRDNAEGRRPDPGGSGIGPGWPGPARPDRRGGRVP